MASVCAVLVAGASLSGCATLSMLRSSQVAADCEGALLSTDHIHGGRRLHDRVRYSSGENSVGYDLVTEVSDDKVLVVVLTTFGNKTMSLQQVGRHVEVTNYLGQRPAVAPLNILRDLHRVHFLRTALVGGDRLDAALRIGKFEITEKVEGATLLRRISGADRSDRTVVAIESEVATVERRGCGYTARFVTIR